MNFKTIIVAPGLWGLSKGDFRKIGREAIEASGKYWHYFYKRKHFQLEAFELYRYHRRTQKYEKAKAKKHPEAGGRPLVFSGVSEELAMSANRVSARATTFEHYHADVTVSAPNLNFHGDEMTKTIDVEDLSMEDKFAEVFEQGMVAAARENGTSSRTIELWKGHANAA